MLRAGRVRDWALLLALVMLAFGAAAAQGQRPFTVDDLFEIEEMGWYYGGPYAFSADGSQLAFTRIRSKKHLANHKWEYLWHNAGGDVWVQQSPAATPVNVTNGLLDRSAWWAPQWSPDGNLLGMLSTRAGNVHLWVWERRSGRLRQLTTRGVDLVSTHERPFGWIDGRRILVPVLPAGEQPMGMKIELQSPRIASAAWPKVERGDEPTASVLESGVPVDLSARPQGEVVVVDAITGANRTILRGSVSSWLLSPDLRAVAVTRLVSRFTPKADQPLAFGVGTGEVTALSVVTIDGAEIPLRQGADVVLGSPRWSPDGSELAFLGHAPGRAAPPLLHRVTVPGGTVTAIPLGALDAAPVVRQQPEIEWTAGGELIVCAASQAADGPRPDVRARRDWYRVRPGGPPVNLTESLASVPAVLWPQEGRRAFFGVAGGELWRILPAEGRAENLTGGLEQPVRELAWPAMTNFGTIEYRVPGRAYSQAIVSAADGAQSSFHVVDLASGRSRPIAKPTRDARLVAFEPVKSTAVFDQSDRNGLRVWRAPIGQPDATLLVEANQFLRDIAEAELTKLEYRSLNGEPLTGWIMLPIGYERGRRYPLLTWVYPGAVHGSQPPSRTINSASSLNLQIAAAKGFAVLFPSMPLAQEGLVEDPMLRLTEGVLPAVDQAVAQGFADPERLFVAGQSFGGFATYGLVTQTRRFKAAISFAGLSNLISLYGVFDARSRYTDEAHENLFTMSLMESAQVGMGGPPWKDLGRYLRNSPIFAVDRVETPIMIIQGDMDYVAIQQGEEFFSALHRQGKRATFVRYWGEGHVLESPANIRDMWSRVFAWLEEQSP